MPHELSEPKIRELSMILHEYKGQRWAPRNAHAVNLSLKGVAEEAPRSVEIAGKPVKIDKAAPAFVEALAAKADEATLEEFRSKGWLLPDDTVDNIDDDGDGAEDYEKIVSLLMGTYYDLSSAMNISGESARGAAITTTIDTFRKNFEDVCGGGEGDVAKAGARHSKVDQKHIDAIASSTGKMQKAMATVGKHADAIASHTAALQPSAPEDSADGDPNADGTSTSKGANENVIGEIKPDPEIAALKAQLEEYRADFAAYRTDSEALIESATRSAAAAIETAKAHEEVAETKLQASKAAAVALARAPQAGGAGPVLDGDLTAKGAPSVVADGATVTKIDRATSSPADVVRLARARANGEIT